MHKRFIQLLKLDFFELSTSKVLNLKKADRQIDRPLNDKNPFFLIAFNQTNKEKLQLTYYQLRWILEIFIARNTVQYI